MQKIENWSTCFASDDPYLPPEMNRLVVRGSLDGRAFFSAIRRTEGRVVHTDDGSYELGAILPDYERWLKETGQWAKFDPENPIRMVREVSAEGQAANADAEGCRPRTATLPTSSRAGAASEKTS